MRLLDAGNIRMAYHALEQTKTQQVGYFLGKSSDHTWRKELSMRFQHHIDQRLIIEKSKCKSIKIQLRPTTARAGGVESTVVSIFVGAADVQQVEEIILKYPFNVEIVLHKWKRHSKTSYDTRLKTHINVCSNSTVIKLTETTPTFRMHIRGSLIGSPFILSIVDVADADHT